MKSRLLVCLVTLIAFTVLGCRKEETSEPAPEAVAKKSTTQVNLPPNSWQVPVDVSGTPPVPQSNYTDLGWQTFVALSWPALSPSNGGQNGQPDTSSTIGATASNGAFVPTVWATFRDLDTIMLDNGVDPGATYTQATAIPSNCAPIGTNPVAPGFSPMYVNASTFKSATFQKDYINQATLNPLVDQKGWYTFTNIRINQSEYDYIQQNGYYLGQNQVNAYKANGQLQPFPRTGNSSLPTWAQYGALEIKSAWRVLDPATDSAIIPRYYTQWGYFMQPDGVTCQGPALFGLIGIHILRLTPSMGGTWFWASFEQIDNTEPPAGIPATLAAQGTPNGNCSNSTGNYNKGPAEVTGNIPWNNTNTPDDICQVTNIPSNVQQANQTWQQNLSGTVWQYYQMVNTANPCPSGGAVCYEFPPIKDPANLINLDVFANTAIESYFQTGNCLDCHGGAAGNGVPTPLTGTNQIFTFVLLNAYFPQNAASTAHAESLRASFHTLTQRKPAPVKTQ